MSHEIMEQRFVERATYGISPAWHRINEANRLPEDTIITPEEAVIGVTGGIEVVEAQVYAGLGDLKHDAKVQRWQDPDQESGGAGNPVLIPDQKAIVRLPTEDDPNVHFLGIVTGKWHPTTYSELAAKLNNLDQAKYKVETVGVLEKGKRCFLSLRGEDWAVLGVDEMKTYFLIQLSLEPGVGHWVRHTPYRVVCKNTETIAVAQSNISLSIPHTADAKQQIGLCADLLVKFKEAQSETKRIFETMAKTPAPDEDVELILRAAFPDPTMPAKLRLVQTVAGSAEAAETFKGQLDPEALDALEKAQVRYDNGLERSATRREAAVESFEAFEPAALRGTVWAAYNACTEVSDWRKGGNSAVACLFGNRAAEKTRAFKAALKVIGADDVDVTSGNGNGDDDPDDA